MAQYVFPLGAAGRGLNDLSRAFVVQVTTGFWKLQYAPVLIVPDNDVKYDLEYGDSWIVCGDNFGASPAYEQYAPFPCSEVCFFTEALAMHPPDNLSLK